MDSKTVQFLTKLVLEDDEDDIVSVTFSNEKRKIKCSISMLAEISPVFEAMFSERWLEKESKNNQLDSVSQYKTIRLEDDVTFNQYLTYKLLMQILYGLRQIDSLSVDEAVGVYFYAHKYQITDVEDKIQKLLNERMESGMSKQPLSVTELTEALEFAHMYQLDEFKNKLDLVKLAIDEENQIKFWDLAHKFEMKTLKEQILHHLKRVAPKEDWKPDILIAVIGCLQGQWEDVEKKINEVKCLCNREYSLFCSYCGNSDIALSTVFPKL